MNENSVLFDRLGCGASRPFETVAGSKSARSLLLYRTRTYRYTSTHDASPEPGPRGGARAPLAVAGPISAINCRTTAAVAAALPAYTRAAARRLSATAVIKDYREEAAGASPPTEAGGGWRGGASLAARPSAPKAAPGAVAGPPQAAAANTGAPQAARARTGRTRLPHGADGASHC